MALVKALLANQSQDMRGELYVPSYEGHPFSATGRVNVLNWVMQCTHNDLYLEEDMCDPSSIFVPHKVHPQRQALFSSQTDASFCKDLAAEAGLSV
jgi:hypothetical protein